MRYFVTLGEREIPVDVTLLPSGAWEARVDGEPLAIDAVAAGGALSVRVEGRVIDLVSDGALANVAYASLGARGEAAVETERTRSLPSRRRAGGTEKLVSAPMPGRIVRLLVAKGDEIEQGAPLVVIEAMKMENELRAGSAATIADIYVAAGDAVEGGAKLILLE